MTRVASKSIYDAYRFRLGRITDKMQTVSTQVASGKRINSVQDDPVGITQVLKLKSNLSNLNQLQRNVATGRTWLSSGETALNQAQDIISEAREICVQMKSANVSTQDRTNGALLVLGHLVNIVGLANTKVSGQYIFSGTNTDTIPYTLDDETNPTTATYAGNSDAFTVKTGKNITVEVGHDGQAVFGNIMTALINLKGYLETDDISGIGATLDTLETEFQNINSEIARIGAKDLRFDTREKIITDLELGYTEKQSELEDIDIIEAVSDMQSTELAYKAALSSSAKVMELSLVDFL